VLGAGGGGDDRQADAERDLIEAADIGLRRVEREITRAGSACALGMLGSALHASARC
jgi:hypothetical protein